MSLVFDSFHKKTPTVLPTMEGMSKEKKEANGLQPNIEDYNFKSPHIPPFSTGLINYAINSNDVNWKGYIWYYCYNIVLFDYSYSHGLGFVGQSQLLPIPTISRYTNCNVGSLHLLFLSLF